MVLFVAMVSGRVRASSAAFSTFIRLYMMLELGGVRTSIAIKPASDAGRNSDPPNARCSPMAAIKLTPVAML